LNSNLTNKTNINYVAFRNKSEHKKIYDKVSRLILVEMIEEQVGIADGDFMVSIVNNDKNFIMETYDSECYNNS
jgi:hypothetical protein